jgi:hypothetical protein
MRKESEIFKNLNVTEIYGSLKMVPFTSIIDLPIGENRMNLKKDILEEYDRDIYYKRIEFAEMLMQETSYATRIDRLKQIALDITLLVSAKKTFEALFNANNLEEKLAPNEPS